MTITPERRACGFLLIVAASLFVVPFELKARFDEPFSTVSGVLKRDGSSETVVAFHSIDHLEQHLDEMPVALQELVFSYLSHGDRSEDCIQSEIDLPLSDVELRMRDSLSGSLQGADAVLFGEVVQIVHGLQGDRFGTLVRMRIDSQRGGDLLGGYAWVFYPAASLSFREREICTRSKRLPPPPQVGHDLLVAIPDASLQQYLVDSLPATEPLFLAGERYTFVVVREGGVDLPRFRKESGGEVARMIARDLGVEFSHAIAPADFVLWVNQALSGKGR